MVLLYLLIGSNGKYEFTKKDLVKKCLEKEMLWEEFLELFVLRLKLEF